MRAYTKNTYVKPKADVIFIQICTFLQLVRVYVCGGSVTLQPKLSTEQLVDCEHRDLGCNGGDIPEAVRYLMKNGMDTDANYPDDSSKSGRTHMCKWSGKVS